MVPRVVVKSLLFIYVTKILPKLLVLQVLDVTKLIGCSVFNWYPE